MKIVLTGSLGNISKPLTQTLVAKGHSVTVISSKAERQKEIEVMGAKAAIGTHVRRKFFNGNLYRCRYCLLYENGRSKFDAESELDVNRFNKCHQTNRK